jgi:Transcriptional regulators
MLHHSDLPDPEEQACRHIKNMITARILRPGGGVAIEALALAARVSPATMRGAAGRLVQEGWLTRLSPETATVRPVTEYDIDNTAQTRLALENQIIERVMPRLMRKQFAYLDALVAQHERVAKVASAMEEFLGLDQGFHMYLAGLTGDSQIMRALRTVRDINMRLGLDMERIKSRLIPCLNEHKALVEALRDADCAAAKQAMAEHIGNAFAAMKLSLRTAA